MTETSSPRGFRSCCFLFCAFLAGAALVRAQENAPAEIIISGQRGYDIRVVPFSGPAGPAATEILRSDLGLSGFFRFSEASRGVFVVQGNANGSQVNGQVTGPDERNVFNRSFESSSLGRSVHQLADEIVRAVTGRRGIASSQIAFVSDRTGNKELYLCDYDGKNVRQVTRDRSISVSPSLSPRGDLLAYTGYASGYADIYLVELASGKRTRIISQPGTNTGAAIAPGNDKLTLTMSFSGNPELYVSGINGGRARQLTNSPGVVESSPAWSPDGQRILYVANGSGGPQLYIMDANGGQPQHLSLGSGYCTEPDWSPDGQRIAFNVREGGAIRVAIHDFQNRVTKTITSGANAENPVWGATSRHLIYVQNNTIYLHDIDTGSRTGVLSNFGLMTELSWSL